MSKLAELHIQEDMEIILRNPIEFDSWVTAIVQNIMQLKKSDFDTYDNFYLRGICYLIHASHLGKVKETKSIQKKLIEKLFKLKKVNRLTQLKNTLSKNNLAINKELETAINSCSPSMNGQDSDIEVSLKTAIDNPEVFMPFANIRKVLEENVLLIDPLEFIESLFKVIPVIFDSNEYASIIYNYAKNTSDSKLREVVNKTLVADLNLSELSIINKQTKEESRPERIRDIYIFEEARDYLGKIAILREKLVDGCSSKQEYVNTLFEIASNYKKAGLKDRAYFFALMVSRLSPRYRNVEALLKE